MPDMNGLNYSQISTLQNGTRYVGHTFRSNGVSLHPLQRSGAVAHRGLGTTRDFNWPNGHFNTDMFAAETNIPNPPAISANVGGVSATRMQKNLL
jgi:hypothetical protein